MMLLMSYGSRAQFMLNDSTYCTSVEEIISWSNKLTVAKAKKDYLKQELIKSRMQADSTSIENYELKKELKTAKKDFKSVRNRYLWMKFKEPFEVAGAILITYIVTKKYG